MAFLWHPMRDTTSRFEPVLKAQFQFHSYREIVYRTNRPIVILHGSAQPRISPNIVEDIARLRHRRIGPDGSSRSANIAHLTPRYALEN